MLRAEGGWSRATRGVHSMRVDPSTIAGALETVERLSRRGAVLADASVPRFFNGAEIDALSTEAASIASDASRARQLLGDAPLESLVRDRLATVVHAATAVSGTSAVKPTIDAIQSFGRSVRDTLRPTVSDVRAGAAVGTSNVLTDVLAAAPRDLSAAALDELRASVALRQSLGLPPFSVGARPISSTDLLAGDPGAHVRLLHRPYLERQGLHADVEYAVGRIDEIIGTDPGRISPVDAAELHALVQAGSDATWKLPRSVAGMPLRDALAQLSRGTDDDLLRQFSRSVMEHRATIETVVPTSAPDHAPVGLRSFVDRDPSSWSAGDWRALATILERDAAAGAPLGVPRAIDGVRGVERIIRDGIRGRAGAADAMQRYLRAWETIVPRATETATDAPADPAVRRLVGELTAIIARDVSELDARDWARFGALLDADSSGTILHGPRELRTALPLARAISGEGDHRAMADRARYIDAWRTTIGPDAVADDVRRSEVHGLLLREPDSLERDDWRRLAALVDGAPASLVDELNLDPEISDLGAIARRHATSQRGVDGHTRLAFASATLAIDELMVDPVRLHGALRDLVDRAPEQLGPNEWARVRALLRADPQGEILDGPRRLTSAPHAEVIATSMMNGRTDMELPARRLLSAWSAHMSGRWSRPEALVDAARRIAVQEPSALTTAEWRELGTMIDVSASTLRAPRSIVGVDPLEVTAARAAEGLPIALPQAERNFRAWRLQFDPELAKPGALSVAARELVDRDPSSLNVQELRRLQSIVDFDAGWNMLGFPTMPDRVPSLTQLIDQGLSGRTIDQNDWIRVVDAWRLHADGIAQDQPRLEAALYEALSPSSGTFDDTSLVRIRSILDADQRGGILDTGRSGGDLMDSLRNVIGSARAAELTVDAPLVDRLRNRLLGAGEVTERRAGIRAAIDGGSFPARTSLEEIREADPRWAERTPFEQLALEARLGAFASGDSFTSARDFLHRARDVRPPSHMPDAMRPLWHESRRLVDVNLERLAGRTPRGQVKGYSTHPDYAQVGRVQSNIELMARISASKVPSTPPDQRVRRIGEAAVAETLSW